MLGAAEAQAAPGLSGAEGKAVEIRTVHAATTDSVSFLRIGFKGTIADELGTGGLKKARVTVELIPASGPSTVITDRKSSRKPDEGRSGTTGRFDVVRDEREIVLLVEELPAAPTSVEVTTSGPVPARASTPSRGIGAGVYDFLVKSLLDAYGVGEDAAGEIKTAEQDAEATTKQLDEVEEQIDELNERIGRAERDRNRANSDAEFQAAKKRIKELNERLTKALQDRKAKEQRLKVLNGWSATLDALPNTRPSQCSDAADNDGDGKVDLTDAGCRDAADNDEKDEPLPLTCPAPGVSRSPFAYIHVAETNTAGAVVLRKAGTGQLVLDAPVTGSSSPPQPVPGDVCGAGIPVTWQYVVYTDGTPFSLPDPPPGHFGICAFIDADNPFGSGNPGGQDASMNFGVATALK